MELVAWTFSKTEVMGPLRHLPSPSSDFVWNQEINYGFENSKEVIVKAVKHGVKYFDPKRITHVSTDWNRILPSAESVLCCSRYTSPAESRYSPLEGEGLEVVWSLFKAKYFVIGCENLIVADCSWGS